MPSFVPLAEDLSGSVMIVDTRAGLLRGCVAEYDKVEGDSGGPKWPSVSAMLAEVAEALRSGNPIGYWRPDVDEGWLAWRLD